MISPYIERITRNSKGTNIISYLTDQVVKTGEDEAHE